LDVDDDCVIVDSTEELVDAIDQFSDQRVLRLFVGEVTPAMRQAFLQVASFGSPTAATQADNNSKKGPNPNTSDMETLIERQIEQVLEKRFRLLEQKRREQEGQGPGEQQQQQRGQNNNNNNSKNMGIEEELNYRSNHQQPSSPPRRRGWQDAPADAEYLESEIFGEDDSLLPDEDQPQYWDSAADNRRHPTGHPPKYSIAGEKRYANSRRVLEPHEYDPTRQSHHVVWNSPRGRDLPMSDLSSNTGTSAINKRGGIRRTPSPAAQMMTPTRSIDPTAEIENHRTSQINHLLHTHYRSRDYDPDEDGDFDDYGSELDNSSRNSGSQLQNDENQSYQDWESGTVDSDAELSLLLSDANDFKESPSLDTRDDDMAVTTNTELNTIRNSKQVDEREESRKSPPNNSAAGKPPVSPTKGAGKQQLPTSPKPSSSSTLAHGSGKPPTPKSNNFNNIPRTPATRKNKLIGILYNSE
jgi:hypothetical protein